MKIGDSVTRKFNTHFTPLINWSKTAPCQPGDVGKIVNILPMQSGPSQGQMVAEVEYNHIVLYVVRHVRIAVLLSDLVKVQI